MPKMLSVYDAAARGIERVRCPAWTDPLEHILLTIQSGQPGFWLQFYSPMNVTINGRDPIAIAVDNPAVQAASPVFVPYLGPTADSQGYRDATASADLDMCIRVGLEELHPLEQDRHRWRRTPWPELGGWTPVQAHDAGHDRAVLELLRRQMRERLDLPPTSSDKQT